jgi:excinuclease UvrABC nuclease subunit
MYEEDPVAFIKDLRQRMEDAVEQLDFETAALIRDEIYALEGTTPKKQKSIRRLRS